MNFSRARYKHVFFYEFFDVNQYRDDIIYEFFDLRTNKKFINLHNTKNHVIIIILL